MPSAGIVTGIGRIHGRLCMVVANDATVKGGTYYPLTVKKHVRAQEIAQREPAALRLPRRLGRRVPAAPGRGVPGQASTSGASSATRRGCRRERIPQIAAVLGSCTAGGAYVPAMSDESIIVKGNGTIFLGGPPLVKAATGEDVTAEDLGGADVHCRKSGVTDHYADSEEHALALVRDLVRRARAPRARPAARRPRPTSRCLPPTEIGGVLPRSTRIPYDVREVIARLVDGSRFQEFKALYGTTLVTGLRADPRLRRRDRREQRHPLLGVVAQGRALHRAVRVPEDPAALPPEHHRLHGRARRTRSGGIAKDGAKLVQAVACADVPKITVIIGGSFGAGNYGMCGRAYEPRFLFMWPNARISVMGGEQAAAVLATVKVEQLEAKGQKLSDAEVEAIRSRSSRSTRPREAPTTAPRACGTTA